MTEHPIIKPHIKRMIWESQNGKCIYCGKRRKIKSMTIDHIIPLSKGGTNDADNIRCCCKICNRLKDNMLPMEFSELLHEIFMNNLQFCDMELQKMNER